MYSVFKNKLCNYFGVEIWIILLIFYISYFFAIAINISYVLPETLIFRKGAHLVLRFELIDFFFIR